MARKKSVEAIDAEIKRVKSDMSILQDRYEKLAENLKELEGRKRRIEADAIMEAYLKSDKSLDEIITFLNP